MPLTELFKSAYRSCCIGNISVDEYRAFLQSIVKYQDLNDTYINIARLHKPSFFVLHHDVHRDIDKMLELAKLEQALGWRANYFLRNVPSVMQYAAGRQMLDWKHDVGLLYDNLDRCSRQKTHSIFSTEERAWLSFQHDLYGNIELGITATACYNRARGVDNRLLWKRYDYHSMNIRCDADVDFCEAEIVYFGVQGRRIRYQKRDCEGHYHRVKPWLKIWSLTELGRRLQAGKKVQRMVLRIVWA